MSKPDKVVAMVMVVCLIAVATIVVMDIWEAL